MDWKIELLAVPVTDIDRAKDFYVNQLGFNADHDIPVDENLRFVQLTPPGSACSARDQLLAGGVDAGEVEEFPWGRFVFFSDPDGNGWALQELPAR